MSIRIYIGNLPQGFNPKEFDTLLKSVSDSIRFKAVLDKETRNAGGLVLRLLIMKIMLIY